MKLKKNFVLRQVAGTWVVLPLGAETVHLSGMLQLNEAGAMLWRVLEEGGSQDALVEALLTGPEAFKGQDPIDSYCGLWDTHM